LSLEHQDGPGWVRLPQRQWSCTLRSMIQVGLGFCRGNGQVRPRTCASRACAALTAKDKKSTAAGGSSDTAVVYARCFLYF